MCSTRNYLEISIVPRPVSSGTYVSGFFGLIVAAAGIALYFTPWVEKAVDNGYDTEALRRPYLAAEQFLAEFAVEVKAKDGLELLDDLPPLDHTLLIASSRRSLSERRSEALMAWAAAGGRLILVASEKWEDVAEDVAEDVVEDAATDSSVAGSGDV